MTSVSIGNGLTTIVSGTFGGCSNLKTVTIGSGVKEIQYQAFVNCTAVQDVFCLAEQVPSTDWGWGLSFLPNATLHVPAASLEAYRTTEPWSQFGTIVALTEEVGDLNSDGKIDIADAVSVLNIMAANTFNEAADVNGDNKVDIADFVTILNIMAGQ